MSALRSPTIVRTDAAAGLALVVGKRHLAQGNVISFVGTVVVAVVDTTDGAVLCSFPSRAEAEEAFASMCADLRAAK